jgi:WD40 repeat protein
VATSGDDGKIRVWDASNGKALLTLSGQSAPVTGLAFHPDGSRLSTLSNDHVTRVWNFATGKVLLTLPIEVQPSDSANSPGTINHGLAFSSDGKRLASTGGDGKVRLWDASTGKVLLTLPGQAGTIYSLAFSPDGKYLAAGGSTSLQLWDVSTGKALSTFGKVTITLSSLGGMYSVAFSPNGTYLAMSRMDKTVQVWNVATGNRLSLSGHGGIVYSLAFSPDSKRLASAGADETVKVWDISNEGGGLYEAKETSRQPLTLFGHSGAIHRVAFSPDGRRLATAGEDGTSRVYALPIEDLMAIAKSRVTRRLTTEECKRFLHMEECPSSP